MRTCSKTFNRQCVYIISIFLCMLVCCLNRNLARYHSRYINRFYMAFQSIARHHANLDQVIITNLLTCLFLRS